MSLAKFEAHLRDVKPGFHCIRAGKKKEQRNWVAFVRHKVRKPASQKALTKLDQYLGKAGTPIRRFYELHNGVVLYGDRKSEAIGIRFFKIKEWEAATSQMRQFMLSGQDDATWPDWFLTGYAFAEIPRSANCFMIDRAGKIYYACHDGWDDNPIAKSFHEFLQQIIKDPAKFLYQHGCYTRFSDGKTKTQWIPTKYFSNIEKLV